MSKVLTNTRPWAVPRLPWPLPAVGAWGCAWVMFRLLEQLQQGPTVALAAALVPPAWVAWRTPGLVRRVLLLAGFPLSLTLLGAASWPAWLWLLPAGLVLVLYPVRAWRDAPMFPTDARALQGLAQRLPLPATARVLDAGCGLGHGLLALQAQWPQAQLSGVEHSGLLAMWARVRCPRAQVQRGDMWRQDWSQQDLVYLFQRPESMGRAWEKACAEMKPGAWLVSLEFAVSAREPELILQQDGHRPVLAYRIPGVAPQPVAPAADKGNNNPAASRAAG